MNSYYVLMYDVQVTALETVFADGPDKVYSCVLSEHLVCFCGILAAGTRCGHVYLIGMSCATHIQLVSYSCLFVE